MGYIKFRITDGNAGNDGVTRNMQIKRFETDLPAVETYDLNIIMHALSKSTIHLLRHPYITSDGQKYMTAGGEILWVRKPYKLE